MLVEGKTIETFVLESSGISSIKLSLLSNKYDLLLFNIGGNNEWRNIDIVKLILKKLNKPETLIEFVEDRLGHDRRYAIDSGKIKEKLGWEPSVPFESGINQTIQWYCDHIHWIERIKNGQYRISE